MIFVTVGTHNYGFNRLIEVVDLLAKELDEDFIVQYGKSDYKLKYCRGIKWIDGERMTSYLSEAEVIITHAGAGSILSALQVNKPLVIIPRMKEYGELLDDHQYQLSRKLEELRRAVVLYKPTVDALCKAIEEAKLLVAGTPKRQTGLAERLGDQLKQWEVLLR